MSIIKANVSRMFETIEPWDVSNSIANLGESASRLTWGNALRIASEHEAWLVSPLADACEGMRDWAKDTGAWDETERNAWSDAECLALFVQNIASELREHLGVDDQDLAACVAQYAATDWEHESGYPTGAYYLAAEPSPVGGDVDILVEYYAGC